MKRIGEDVAEKLGYTLGTFTVERHSRGKWACTQCETLVQAPVPVHVIDKGIPTTGLLAHVLIAKYLELPFVASQGQTAGKRHIAARFCALGQWPVWPNRRNQINPPAPLRLTLSPFRQQFDLVARST